MKHNLNEATFSSKNIRPLMKILGKLFGKSFGSPFVLMAVEQFKRSDGIKGIGYRLVNDNGTMIRVNFKGIKKAMSQEFSHDAMFISGLDYWKAGNTNFERADLNVEFSRDVNILQIYKGLMTIIKRGQKGKFNFKDINGLRESVKSVKPVEEARDHDEREREADYLVRHGLKKTAAWRSKKMFDDTLRSAGLYEDFYAVVETGVPEVNTTSKNIKANEKLFDETPYADPDTIFTDIENYVKTFANKAFPQRSLIICGMGGVGKCLALDTKVRTPSGFVTMADIQVGDYVLTPQGQKAKVTEKYCQKDHQLYEVVLSDGRSVEADDEQLFNVFVDDEKEPRNVLLSKIRENPSRYGVPLPMPIENPIMVGTPDPYETGLRVVSSDRHEDIPAVFKMGSIHQRLEVLRGILDSAGYINGEVNLDTNSKDLAYSIRNICTSLGGVALVNRADMEGKLYNVKIVVPAMLGNIFKENESYVAIYEEMMQSQEMPKLEITRIYPTRVDETACIMVDSKDHLILVNDYFVIHNTFHVTKAMKDVYGTDPDKWVYHAAMKTSPNSFYETVFRDRDQIIVFDEADDILCNPDVVTMLKPLLDTSGDNRCEWSIQTAPMTRHSDDEIRAYCDNLTKAIDAGIAQGVYARRVQGEVDKAWFQPRDISGLGASEVSTSSKAATLAKSYGVKVSPDTVDEIEKSVRGFLPSPSELAKAIESYISNNGDDEGSDDDFDGVTRSVVDRYKDFLMSPSLNLSEVAGGGRDIINLRWPSIFFFTGKMIFITNKPAEKMDQAVVSRGALFDVHLMQQDVRKRILTILGHMNQYSEESRNAVTELINNMDKYLDKYSDPDSPYLDPRKARQNKQLTVRWCTTALGMYEAGTPDWQRLALMFA